MDSLQKQITDHYNKEAEGTLTPNIPLLRKAVEWVEQQDQLPWEDREWDQSVYVMQTDHNQGNYHFYGEQGLMKSCGTVMCVAGYLALNFTPTEWQPMKDGLGYYTDEMYDTRFEDVPHEECDLDDCLGYTYTAAMDRIASMLLGLSHAEASNLFKGGNDAQDVRLIAEMIAGERL